jgi:uncharacterized protein YabN with tetrapyrrole methylase and pyrophosphatase domain
MNELHAAEKKESPEKVMEEMGDLLFALVNYARFIKTNRRGSLKAIQIPAQVITLNKIFGMNISITNPLWEELVKYWKKAKKSKNNLVSLSFNLVQCPIVPLGKPEL